MRLLVVDDEPLTRASLVEHIPKKALGFEEVYTASNGRTAYQMAMMYRPDVVLCDIRMPKMDGLELAQKLREAFPEIKIIFISGYADKEYLKTAIALQAVGYVEKPINLEELTNLLETAVRQVRNTQHLHAKSKELNHAREEVETLVWQKLINELFSTSCNPEDMRSRYGQGFFDWPDQGLYAAACLRVVWPDPLNIHAVEDSARALLDLASKVLNNAQNDTGIITGLVSFSRVGIVIKAHNRDTVKSLLQELVQQIEEKYPELIFHIGVSSFTNRLVQLAERYQDALGMAQWADFAEKKSLCIINGSLHVPLQTDAPEALAAALRKRSRDIAQRTIVDLTKQVSKLDYSELSAIRHLYERLLITCLDAEINESHSTVDQYTKMGLLGAFSKLRTLRELMRFLLSRIDHMFPEIEIPDNIHPKIIEAIQFVQDHISDHTLSIQKIATYLDITENYLCALYKKETGITINHTIVQARIERAKRLMVSNDKLYEVADQSGFADPNYFSVVFKKHTGISPTQFRRDVKRQSISKAEGDHEINR